MDKSEKINLLKAIEEYRDSISNDLEQLENIDRSCCNQAEYETLMNVEASLSIIINSYINQEYPFSWRFGKLRYNFNPFFLAFTDILR